MQTIAGWIGAARSKDGLTALTLPMKNEHDSIHYLTLLGVANNYIFAQPESGHSLCKLEEALDSYFSGKYEDFNFPVDWSAYTPFQQQVLRVVRGISYGSLLSYGQVAALAGYPRAARAVGGALGSNRILLVIPCHRVIRGDGMLGGFGGRPEWKNRLLTTEGVIPGPDGKYHLCNI